MLSAFEALKRAITPGSSGYRNIDSSHEGKYSSGTSTTPHFKSYGSITPPTADPRSIQTQKPAK